MYNNYAYNKRAFAEDDNTIAVHYRMQPVGHRQHRAVGELLPNGVLNDLISPART